MATHAEPRLVAAQRRSRGAACERDGESPGGECAKEGAREGDRESRCGRVATRSTSRTWLRLRRRRRTSRASPGCSSPRSRERWGEGGLLRERRSGEVRGPRKDAPAASCLIARSLARARLHGTGWRFLETYPPTHVPVACQRGIRCSGKRVAANPFRLNAQIAASAVRPSDRRTRCRAPRFLPPRGEVRFAIRFWRFAVMNFVSVSREPDESRSRRVSRESATDSPSSLNNDIIYAWHLHDLFINSTAVDDHHRCVITQLQIVDRSDLSVLCSVIARISASIQASCYVERITEKTRSTVQARSTLWNT